MPSTSQQIDFLCSSANQNPLAALKQRTALIHPLAHAPGFASIFRRSIEVPRFMRLMNRACSGCISNSGSGVRRNSDCRIQSHKVLPDKPKRNACLVIGQLTAVSIRPPKHNWGGELLH